MTWQEVIALLGFYALCGFLARLVHKALMGSDK